MSPMVRIGAWGPLFGGVTLLTGLSLVVSVFRRPRRTGMIAVVVAPVLLSVVVNPVCWNARYVPQSWLVPLIVAVMMLAMSKYRPQRILAGAILVTAGANSALVAAGHVPAVVYNSKRLQTHLVDLEQLPPPVEVDFGSFRANRVRLAELGIGFIEVDDPRRSLPVYNGFAPARITGLELDEGTGDDWSAFIAWQPTEGADAYIVEVRDPNRVGRDGESLLVDRRQTSVCEMTVPLPDREVNLYLEICNTLGCCAPKVLGLVDVDRGGSS